MAKSLKHTFILWLIFVFFALGLYLYIFKPYGRTGPDIGKVSVGETAPEIELTSIDGKKSKLSDYRGKAVFLNFWASWCNPCKAELPDIQEMSRRMDANAFVVVAVSVDTTGADKLKEFLNDRGISFPVYLDPTMTAAKRYGVTGFPETFILDKKGVIVKRYVGPREWTSRSMLDIFKGLAAE